MRTMLAKALGLLALALLALGGAACGGGGGGGGGGGNGGGNGGTPDFTVTASLKDTTHPEFGNGHSEGYVVNGVQGMEITLTRGTTYTFQVNAPGHPFYFTTDPTGGLGAPGRVSDGVSNDLITDGTVTFTPGAGLPAQFFYQCGVHEQMGWRVILMP